MRRIEVTVCPANVDKQHHPAKLRAGAMAGPGALDRVREEPAHPFGPVVKVGVPGSQLH